MTIKEEFENEFKDFKSEWPSKVMIGNGDFTIRPYDSALWAAKWMAERCAKVVENSKTTNWMCADEIRKLIKELQ